MDAAWAWFHPYSSDLILRGTVSVEFTSEWYQPGPWGNWNQIMLLPADDFANGYSHETSDLFFEGFNFKIT